MLTTTYIHMNTDNDRNGNPRRLFLAVTIDGDQPDMVKTEAINEGYEGKAALFRVHPDARYITAIEISVSEYRRLLQRYPVIS